MDIFSNFKFKSYQRGNISNQEPLTATFHPKISNFSTIFNNFYTLCYSFLHIFALNLKKHKYEKTSFSYRTPDVCSLRQQ